MIIQGLFFFEGQEHIPGDLIPNLTNLRKWAIDEGLIYDPEFQFLNQEIVNSLSAIFASSDGIQIAIAIHEEGGDPFYLEYPFLPVKSLIKRGVAVEIYYWKMRPTRWDKDGNITHFGEVRFGFLYPGCHKEICSVSTGKRVVEKFNVLYDQLVDRYSVKIFDDGAKEITVDGAVRAKFFKDGRYFDVENTLVD